MPFNIKPIINKEEFETLLKYTLKHGGKNKKQYALAMILGFEAGMRISEIVGLRIEGEYKIPKLTVNQIDFDKNYITVKQGKGKKDRTVPLPKKVTKAALKELPLKLSRNALQWWVTKIGKEIIHKKISFHTLRAGFVTHALDSGVPIHHVQVLAGHSDISTTGVYARASPKEAVKRVRDVF